MTPVARLRAALDRQSRRYAKVDKHPPRFMPDEIIEHVRTGGMYMVLHSPPGVYIEKDQTPVYVYQSVADNRIWIRPRIEMEDGRFRRIR